MNKQEGAMGTTRTPAIEGYDLKETEDTVMMTLTPLIEFSTVKQAIVKILEEKKKKIELTHKSVHITITPGMTADEVLDLYASKDYLILSGENEKEISIQFPRSCSDFSLIAKTIEEIMKEKKKDVILYYQQNKIFIPLNSSASDISDLNSKEFLKNFKPQPKSVL